MDGFKIIPIRRGFTEIEQYTNKYNLPESLVNTLIYDDYDLKDAPPNVVSLTEMIDSPKARILRRRHKNEIVVDVSTLLWRTAGTAFHRAVELANAHAIVEKRWFMSVNTGAVFVMDAGGDIRSQSWYRVDCWYLSGKLDILIDGVLEDYKYTSVWSAVYAPEGRSAYHAQVNINAFAMRHMNEHAKALRVILVLRDWSKRRRHEDGYPVVPFLSIDVPMWSEEECYEYIMRKMSEYTSDIELTDDSISECDPEDRWHKPGKLAVMKGKNKRASKLFEPYDRQGAMDYIEKMDNPGLYRIENRPDENTRCEDSDYCEVRQWCNFYNGVVKPYMEGEENGRE
jgi:hypothetical protein